MGGWWVRDVPWVAVTTPLAPARLSDATLPQLDLSTPPWPGRTVTVAGGSLHVRHTPGPEGGEPALYLHGLGGQATNWTDLAALLAGYLDGEAVDLPGFGWSGAAARGDYSLAGHARAVAGYLEQRDCGPVHLFGNSMGGAIAIMLAATRPHLVRTLTLVSPAVPDASLRRREERMMPLLLIPGVGRLAERRLASIDPAVRVRQVLELCYGDPSLVPPQRLAEAAEDARKRAGQPWQMTAFVRSLRGLVGGYLPGSRSLWRLAASITAPTLVIWGDRDKLVNVRVAPWTARAIPGARLRVLPGVGHVAQMEDPVTVARAFLALREDAARKGGGTGGDTPPADTAERARYGRLSG
jgi:pimeloyl-ACP methyl ester carboxylesterase